MRKSAVTTLKVAKPKSMNFSQVANNLNKIGIKIDTKKHSGLSRGHSMISGRAK
ncbi:hypothetical protein [Cytobacillus kochii]|uniref:hypothetical protein n=1 Tax=Cytobacillus kochii TaxID=859143 RepID=UPI0025A23FAC|nr:hypothetical protein [Cytobacillus kochii]MDM5209220.1 hypothetical protein [Cytobacillus kochii]